MSGTIFHSFLNLSIYSFQIQLENHFHDDEDDELGEEGELPTIETVDTPLDPLAEAYIERILGQPKKTELPLGNPSKSDYIEKLSGTF